MKTPRTVIILIGLFATAQLWAKAVQSVAQNDVDADLEKELQLDDKSTSNGKPSKNDTDTLDNLDQAVEPAKEAPPAPEIPPEEPKVAQPQPPAEPTQAEAPEPNAKPVTITGLDFKGNENGGTVVIKTSGPATYTTRAVTEKNQFVVEVQNAKLPKKFQRPYNTKEFSGPIGFIRAYQTKGSSVAHIVIQMKGAEQPSVQQDGNSILVMSMGTTQNQAENQSENKPEEEVKREEPPSQAEAEDVKPEASDTDQQILKGRTLDDFLSGNMKFYGHPISIQVKDADVRDVFNFISDESGLNLVLSDEVQGKVNLKLKEIPWDQALVVVMQSKQLGYVRQGTILRIAPLKSIQSETDATRALVDSQRQLEPLRIRVFSVSYAQAKDLEPNLASFVSPRGKIKADPRTNTIVVTDINEVLNKIAKLLVTLDAQTPQVLIEGKIVEAREDFERDIGINWNWNSAAPQQAPGSGVNNNTEKFLGFSALAATPALSVGPLVGRINSWDTVNATLQLNETENNAKVLSSPRIVTLNNKKATIQQITELPLFTSSTINGQTTSSVTYKPAKLQLDVTPQITSDGGVVLDLTVVREFFGATQTVGGQQAAPLNGRTATTSVLVNNGETAVIGGLYQLDQTDSETGIPFLRSIPLLGKLFEGDNNQRHKTELIIFLSPRVLNREKAFSQRDALPSEPAPDKTQL